MRATLASTISLTNCFSSSTLAISISASLGSFFSNKSVTLSVTVSMNAENIQWRTLWDRSFNNDFIFDYLQSQLEIVWKKNFLKKRALDCWALCRSRNKEKENSASLWKVNVVDKFVYQQMEICSSKAVELTFAFWFWKSSSGGKIC